MSIQNNIILDNLKTDWLIKKLKELKLFENTFKHVVCHDLRLSFKDLSDYDGFTLDRFDKDARDLLLKSVLKEKKEILKRLKSNAELLILYVKEEMDE